MLDLDIFSYRTAAGTTGRLRGEITKEEMESFVKLLKLNKSAGPSQHQAEIIRTMSPVALEILREWANQFLRSENPRTPSEDDMRGMISLLHKGKESTDNTSDWLAQNETPSEIEAN